MALILQFPPTHNILIDIDRTTERPTFDVHWLKWFLDLAKVLNSNFGIKVTHNTLTGLDGGDGTNFFHFSAAQTIGMLGGRLADASLFHTHRGATTVVTTPAVGASPVTFTNSTSYTQTYVIKGVSVSQIAYVTAAATTIDLGFTNGAVTVFPNDKVKITYSGAAPVVYLISR